MENLGKDRSPFELEEIRGCPPARREGHVLSLVIILYGRSHDMCGRQIVRHCLGVLDQYSELAMMMMMMMIRTRMSEGPKL